MVNSSTSVKAIIEESPVDIPNDSIQKQNNEIQLRMEISGDSDRQALSSYYIQNCGFVCLDSFNAHNNQIKNSDRRTTVDDRTSSNDEVPYARPEERFSGHMPSSGPDLCSFPTNPLVHTQIRLNPNTLAPPLQPITQAPVQNAVPKEVTLSNPSETTYQLRLDPTNTLQPVPPSDSSPSDDTHHSLTHPEQYQESSLANVVIIQLSGDTLADILSPPAYNAFKAHVASDVSISSTKRIVADPPTHFSTSSLAVPSTSRRHILIPVHCVAFSLASLVVLAFFIIANGC